MRIKVADIGAPPVQGEYDDDSTPSTYCNGVCTLHKSLEWLLMERMGLEVEYTVQVLTHEQALHATTAKLLHRTIEDDRLVHLGDLCALMGF